MRATPTGVLAQSEGILENASDSLVNQFPLVCSPGGWQDLFVVRAGCARAGPIATPQLFCEVSFRQ
jgi:hypothetical protein